MDCHEAKGRRGTNEGIKIFWQDQQIGQPKVVTVFESKTLQLDQNLATALGAVLLDIEDYVQVKRYKNLSYWFDPGTLNRYENIRGFVLQFYHIFGEEFRHHEVSKF